MPGTWESMLVELQQTVDRLRGGREGLRVLEAGCGSSSHFDPGPGAHLLGVDISEKQLERNAALGEKLVGDIQALDLDGRQFDIVVCWDVLEHLPRPADALRDLAAATAPGGVLILAMPNPLSLKGLVTKLTPYRAHVFVYRVVFGNPSAGTDDRGPFHTFMRFAIASRSIVRAARQHGLTVLYQARYESPMQKEVRRKYPPVDLVWRTGALLLRTLSAGRVEPGVTDVVLVLHRSV